MKLLFTLCAFFIFTIPVFGQAEIDEYLYSSKRFAFSKRYEEAIEEINKAIDIQPSNADLYLKRAYLYGLLQNRTAALENVLIAVSLNPEAPDFLENCVEKLNLSGNYDESLKIAERLISTNERYKTLIGYRIRYKTRFLIEDFSGAIEDIIKSQDVDAAYYEGSELYAGKDAGTFVSDGLLLRILDELKEDPKIFLYYGELLAIIKELKKKEFGSIHSLFMIAAIDCSVYARYALLYEAKHTPAETTRLLDEYAKENGLERRAEVYRAMKKYELAVKDLTEVLKTTRAKPHYLLARGDIYIALKQFDKAIVDYETAVEIDKDYTDSVKKRISEARTLRNGTRQPK